MALSDDLRSHVAGLFAREWNIATGRVVPNSEGTLTLKNDGTTLDATVLYADLADSTVLVDTYPAWFAAEIYKAFLTCAARIISVEGGEITAYDGDRVMAVFIGEMKADRAVRTAQKINWAVLNIIRPAIALNYPSASYVLKHVCGIDSSELLVAKIGVRAATDLVWVGRAANYAAKLASEDDAHSTYITADVYFEATDRVKLAGGVGENLWWLTPTTTLPHMNVVASNSEWRIDAAP